jgi:small nuclear ribonucleoprotein (snRNP)-like protein
MPEVLLSVALVAALAVLAAVVLQAHRRQDPVLASKLKRSVLVTFKTGEAFGGVLMESDDVHLVLRQVMELRGEVAVDGELLIRWADVSFIQVP